MTSLLVLGGAAFFAYKAWQKGRLVKALAFDIVGINLKKSAIGLFSSTAVLKVKISNPYTKTLSVRDVQILSSILIKGNQVAQIQRQFNQIQIPAGGSIIRDIDFSFDNINVLLSIASQLKAQNKGLEILAKTNIKYQGQIIELSDYTARINFRK